MNSDKKHWLAVYLIPYTLVGIFTLGVGLFILPLGGTLGVIVGLSSTEPYFTSSFKLALGLALCVAIFLFIVGYKYRNKLWGKIINAVGFYLWCFAGVVGFGPQ